MFQPVRRSYKSEGKHRLRLYMIMSEKFRRGSRIGCLKFKNSTNVWENERNIFRNSQFLESAMGQGSTI